MESAPTERISDSKWRRTIRLRASSESPNYCNGNVDFLENLIFWKKSAQQLCENFPLVLLLNPVNSVPLWKLKAVSQETRVFKTKSDKGTKWEKTPSFQKVMGGNFTKLLEEQRRIGSNNSDVIMNNTFIVSKKNDHSFGLFSVFLIKNEESWRYCLFPEGALYFCESQKSKHSPSYEIQIIREGFMSLNKIGSTSIKVAIQFVKMLKLTINN